METITQIVNTLESAGLVGLFIAICVKFIIGVVIAVQENKFEWDKIGYVLKNDMLKYVTVLVLVYMYRDPLVFGPVIALLGVDMATGIARNVGRLFPAVANQLPDSIIETPNDGVPNIVEK